MENDNTRIAPEAIDEYAAEIAAGVSGATVAIATADGWSVADPAGGRWWPSEDAQAEIAAAPSPADAAVVMCDTDPMRGEWRT